MGPADLAPNTAPPETRTKEEATKVERNAFYSSLPLAAQERFLAALEEAAVRGASEEEAWEAASRAVVGSV